VQPVLRGFSAGNGYKQYDIPYHPGALKYFKEHNIQAKAAGVSEAAPAAAARSRAPRRSAPTSCRDCCSPASSAGFLTFRGASSASRSIPSSCSRFSLGLGLALSFVARHRSEPERSPHWLEWLGAALSLGICLYITVRYEPLSYELAMLPMEGIVGSAFLVLMVLIATARTAGAVLAASSSSSPPGCSSAPTCGRLPHAARLPAAACSSTSASTSTA